MRLLYGLMAFGLGAAACSNECGPEIRDTESTATIRDTSQASIGIAYVMLSEEKDDPRYARVLFVGFGGPNNTSVSPLRGHVRRARLLGATGDTLYEVRVQNSPDYAPAVVLTMTEYSIPSERYARIRQDLLAGAVVVEVDTDLAGMEVIRTPMPSAQPTQFRRAVCSY
jgi:hypothetical protein